MVEPLPVHRSTIFARGNVNRTQMEKSSGQLKALATAVTENGAVGILQLTHLGQHRDGEVSFFPNWSPSGLPSFIGSTGSHEMSEDDIETVIAASSVPPVLPKARAFMASKYLPTIRA